MTSENTSRRTSTGKTNREVLRRMFIVHTYNRNITRNIITRKTNLFVTRLSEHSIKLDEPVVVAVPIVLVVIKTLQVNHGLTL